MSLGVCRIARPLPKGAAFQVLAHLPNSLDKRTRFMVTTATNHRPITQTAPISNNRMAKDKDKDKDKAAKKQSKKSETPHGILETSPELRNAVAAIEKQFGEGSIMPLSGDQLLPIEGISTGSLSLDIALG